MSSNPKVSIIIPCYNSAWSLPRLADNLKQIDYPNYEIVFVDDGSADNSYELFSQLVPAAHLIRQENKGLPGARNTGVKAAQGAYLQLLDADDTIEPLKLKTQVEIAQCENAEVVWSDWRMVIVNQGQIDYQPFQQAKPPTEMIEALLLGWWAPPVAYLFSREAYLDVGGCDENLRVWEDFDLFLRLAAAGKHHLYIPGRLANYHRYLQIRSVSRRDPKENVIYREQILNKTIQMLKAKGQLTVNRRKAAAQAFHGIARSAFEYDSKWFDRLICSAYEMDPAFTPQGTSIYRTISRLLGLAITERLAILYRNLGKHLMSTKVTT